MAEIHNLRRFRKVQRRASSEQQAAENRAFFGRSKTERQNAELNAALEAQRLTAHRRQDPEEPESKLD